jgi:hypothetical protein
MAKLTRNHVISLLKKPMWIAVVFVCWTVMLRGIVSNAARAIKKSLEKKSLALSPRAF